MSRTAANNLAIPLCVVCFSLIFLSCESKRPQPQDVVGTYIGIDKDTLILSRNGTEGLYTRKIQGRINKGKWNIEPLHGPDSELRLEDGLSYIRFADWAEDMHTRGLIIWFDNNDVHMGDIDRKPLYKQQL